METFHDLVLADLTAPALVGITILLLLTGRLIPRSNYKDKSDEAERWRKAYEAEKEARMTSDAQTTELLELAKTTHNIIAAMFISAGFNKRPGGPNDLPGA